MLQMFMLISSITLQEQQHPSVTFQLSVQASRGHVLPPWTPDGLSHERLVGLEWQQAT